MSNSDFLEKFKDLIDQYNSYAAQAQNTARRKKSPSEEEYQLYLSAARTAEEISRLNASTEATRQKWEALSTSCNKKAIIIYKMLHPPVVPSDDSQKESEQEDSYVTTPSGFRTKNAGADVPAEMIERWYRTENVQHSSLDDVVGMDDIKKLFREKLLDAVDSGTFNSILPQCYLFYGPFGTGKTFCIEAIAGELTKRGFSFLQLSLSDVHSCYVGVGEKVLKTAFQEAIDKAPCVLFLDELEGFCGIRPYHERLSVAFLEACQMLITCRKPVVLLAASHYPDRINRIFIERMQPSLVPAPLPSEEVRTEFFRTKLKSNIHFSDDIDEAYMAAATNQYSFRDMDRIVVHIYSKIKRQAIEQFSVRDENGCIVQCAESDEKVKAAIENGLVVITKELFDEIVRHCYVNGQSEFLAYIKAFEKSLGN